MRIAVTGASGFLGKNLCFRLRNLGHELFEYNSKNLDLTTTVQLPDSIDVLYHLAANSRVYRSKKDPLGDFKINALGTLHILEAMRRSGIKKIIYTSTDLVYKNLVHCSESDDVGANEVGGPYSFNKLIGEYYIQYYAKLYDLNYVILRPSSYYGPGMKKNAIFDIITGFLKKDKVHLFHDIDSQFDFIYVEDAVEALLLALNWKNEIVNVSVGESASLRKLYNTIKDIIGYDVPLTYEGELIKISVDNSKLKKLGWQKKYSLIDGMKKTVESFILAQNTN
jgi:UDP-glucose 4-epimerase